MRNYDKSYNAVAGQQYSESLPIGYASAVFVNQSGHYILVRAGALTAPGNIQSAEHLIPPNSVSAINLRSMFIAFAFTDLVTGLSANLSTGLDGVCKVSYTLGAVVEYTQLLPGSTTASMLAAPTNSPYSYAYTVDLLGPTPASAQYILLLSGGVDHDPSPPRVFLRYCKAALCEDLSGGAGGSFELMIAPLTPPHAGVIYILANTCVGLTAADTRQIEFGPTAPGADLRIPYNYGLYINGSVDCPSVYGLAEYRTVA